MTKQELFHKADYYKSLEDGITVGGKPIKDCYEAAGHAQAYLMEHFINQMQSSKRLMHPIEFAALCHKRLDSIYR